MNINALSSTAPLSKPNTFDTFQGQETETSFDLGWSMFAFRTHDPQIGRFLQIDPLAEDYFYNSPYAFAENKVISYLELEGLEAGWAGSGHAFNLTNSKPFEKLPRKEKLRQVKAASKALAFSLAAGLTAGYAYANAPMLYNAGMTGSATYGPELVGLGAGVLGLDEEIPGTSGDNLGRLVNKGFDLLSNSSKLLDNASSISSFADEIIAINKKTQGEGVLIKGDDPTTLLFSASYYDNVIDQGAAIFKGLLTGHLFKDGNHRTAVDALKAFAEKSNLSISLQGDELFDFAKKVSNGDITDVEEIGRVLTGGGNN